jgi:single-strand DNA-binding protein
MSKGTVNRVILVGRLGQDPQNSEISPGRFASNFTLATNESWKDKSGAKQDVTDWHKIAAYGKLAEICGQYLKKGSLVYVEGKLKTRDYEKDGVKRYITEIVIHEMQMLGSKGESSGESSDIPKDSSDLPF